jgi:hypothetical protein
MALTAARRQKLQRACDLVHDRAFNPGRYMLPPAPSPAPSIPVKPEKSRKEWLEERFQQAVQKEFARLGLV